MSEIDVRPVSNQRQQRIFLEFPWSIYTDDPLWVPPLLPERAKTIDPQRGPFFKRGQAEFFVAWRKGRPVGTICAAEDPPANHRRGTKECMIGFFECVDDREVAVALFDTAQLWAEARGLEALFGPFNLDYEDSYGVLIEGRDRPPALLCGHSPVYYQRLFEDYGFEPARGDNLAFEIRADDESPQRQRLRRLADGLRRRGKFKLRQPDFDAWESEIDCVHNLLNESLKHLPDHIGWERESVRATLGAFRQLADPELILFAEADGRTVGWFPGLPNLNEALIEANGLRHPWDYARLWWRMRQPFESMTIKSVLVMPEYWDTGVALLMFDEMDRRARAKGYRWADLSLTSEDNPRTPQLAERMGARIYKRYRVYRKPIIDR
ncbi:MAG: GNAT family N-acetyltransferase [Anaerolineales bacterium]|jgi:GNAT superfamily N-acetyltransferase